MSPLFPNAVAPALSNKIHDSCVIQGVNRGLGSNPSEAANPTIVISYAIARKLTLITRTRCNVGYLIIGRLRDSV
jgi:hypothetical protein